MDGDDFLNRIGWSSGDGQHVSGRWRPWAASLCEWSTQSRHSAPPRLKQAHCRQRFHGTLLSSASVPVQGDQHEVVIEDNGTCIIILASLHGPEIERGGFGLCNNPGCDNRF